MSNRNDKRYTDSNNPNAILRAWVNGADLGGWTDGDENAFREVVIAEAAHGFGVDPSDVEGVRIERVQDDAELITDERIQGLRDEAGAAGDAEQVALCDAALDGDDDAREACAQVINDARAML
jgi:hypothetical protein